MSSLLEIYKQELQIFQKLFCPRLKPTIDDNQIFKIRKNNGHMKVEASLENDKERARAQEIITSYVDHLYNDNYNNFLYYRWIQ
jgi:hypothetical protein